MTTARWSALQDARGKARICLNKKLLELQRLATESIGTTDVARQRGLVCEQQQVLEELRLITVHLEALEAEMMQVVERADLDLDPRHWAAASGHPHGSHRPYCQR
jgi:hypothetical protein